MPTKTFRILPGTCPLTGEAQNLAGLLLEQTGPGGMVAEACFRVITPAAEAIALMAKQGWTPEMVHEYILDCDCLEFDFDQLEAVAA